MADDKKRDTAQQSHIMLQFILQHGSITYDEALGIGIKNPHMSASNLLFHGHDIFSSLTGKLNSRGKPEREWYISRQAMEQRKERNQ